MSYLQTSPYLITEVEDGYLGVLQYRSFPKQRDDVMYTIRNIHEYRPDLLAQDLYGDANLWWVFAVRNPNSIEDPIYDFQAGKTIYLPKLATLKEALGI